MSLSSEDAHLPDRLAWLSSEFILSTLVASIVVGFFSLNVDLWYRSSDAFRDWGDIQNYISLATDPASCNHALQCNRILKPWLAGRLPGDLETGFVLVTIVSLTLTGVAVYFIARELGFSVSLSLVGLLAYYTTWAFEFQLANFWQTGSLANFLFATAILAVLREREIMFVVLLLLGVSTRETSFFLLAVYYAYNADRPFDSTVLARSVLYFLLAFVVWNGVQFLLPSRSYRLLEWLFRPGKDSLNSFLVLLDDPAFAYDLFIRPYGLLIVLPLFALARNYREFLPLFGPYWIVSHFPFLIVTVNWLNSGRQLAPVIPVVVVLSLAGLESLAGQLSALFDRFEFRPAYFAPLFVVILLIEALDGRPRPPLSLQMQLVLFVGFLATVVAAAGAKDLVNALARQVRGAMR